jgi:hypothetical protein
VLSRIREFFRSAPPPEPVSDEVLGVIRFNSEQKIWEARIAAPLSWRICIGGGAAPDENLLAHAREVAANHDHFSESVSSFLRSEAANFPGAEKEILSLQLESLGLFWPARPNDGMLFFEGGEEGRVWRCDYINRKPSGLGFDS